MKGAGAPKLQGQCAQYQGAAQSVWQAIKGAASNTTEDAGLGTLSIIDKVTAYETAGLIKPTLAADFYSWWNGLSPAQQQQLQANESQLVDSAAQETAQQAGDLTAGLVTAAGVGFAAYLAALEWLP